MSKSIEEPVLEAGGSKFINANYWLALCAYFILWLITVPGKLVEMAFVYMKDPQQEIQILLPDSNPAVMVLLDIINMVILSLPILFLLRRWIVMGKTRSVLAQWSVPTTSGICRSLGIALLILGNLISIVSLLGLIFLFVLGETRGMPVGVVLGIAGFVFYLPGLVLIEVARRRSNKDSMATS